MPLKVIYILAYLVPVRTYICVEGNVHRYTRRLPESIVLP